MRNDEADQVEAGSIPEPGYQTIFETTDDGIFVFDVERGDGDISFSFRLNNPAHEEITGMTTEEYLGRGPLSILGEASGKEVLGNYRTCVEKRETIEYEETLEHPSGTVHWHTKLSPVIEDGEVTQIVGISRDITERKEHERELKRREAYLEQSSDIISVMNPDGTVKFQSETTEQVTGFDPKKVMGSSGFDHVHPDDRGKVQSYFEDFVNQPGERASMELRVRTTDDSWRWIEVKGVNRIDDPLIEGLLFSSRDITERKEHELELRRFEAFIENSPTMVTLLDTDGTVLLDMSGVGLDWRYPSEEILGESILEFIHEDDQEEVLEALDRLLQNPGEARSVEYRFEDRHGDWRWIRSYGVSQVDDPLIGGIIVNSSDISERKEAEQELARHKTFVESSNDVIAVLDENIRIEYISPAVERIIGYEPEEVIGENGFKFVHEDDRERFIEDQSGLLEDPGAETKEEYRFEHVDGSYRWLELRAQNLFDNPDVQGILVSSTDVTDRVATERTLEEQRDNLRVLNQVVRHDIRNDMTVIHGRARLLKDNITEAGEEDLVAVLKATNNAIELTKTARDLAATMLRSEDDIEPVTLSPFIQTPIENARAKFGDSTIIVEGELPSVRVHANDLLESVFRNVIHNAIVHNDKAEPTVTIASDVSEGSVTISIADNGPGIPDAHKETIFGKEEKGLESEGTGIGLYLVKTLVEQYGGEVWVEDNEPTGSVFYIGIPTIDE